MLAPDNMQTWVLERNDNNDAIHIQYNIYFLDCQEKIGTLFEIFDAMPQGFIFCLRVGVVCLRLTAVITSGMPQKESKLS